MMYGKLCTEFYDADKRFAESDEVDFYKKFLDKKSLILEPMCGSGRLLIPLLQQGYTVHGVDNSPAMLKSCKDRAAQVGVVLPALFEKDILKMSLPDQYQAILIPFGSFQLLYPRDFAFKVLENFKKHLLPRGKLILDLFVPWEVLYENNKEEKAVREIVLPEGEIIVLKSHAKVNKYNQFYYSEAVYTKIVDGRVIAEENEQMHLCWYYHYEMSLILEKIGFKNIEYREEYFKSENHMMFIAEG